MKLQSTDIAAVTLSASVHEEMLREIREDIARIKAQLETLLAVEAYHAGKAGKSRASQAEHHYLENNGQSLDTERANKGKSHGRLAGLGQREAAIEVMREAGRPMRCGDIARSMVSGGYVYKQGTAKLANTLFTSLRRGPGMFAKTGKGLWALRIEPEATKQDDED
jgi:HB1, ASXL, restriction endonuclease HTH domain